MHVRAEFHQVVATERKLLLLLARQHNVTLAKLPLYNESDRNAADHIEWVGPIVNMFLSGNNNGILHIYTP